MPNYLFHLLLPVSGIYLRLLIPRAGGGHASLLNGEPGSFGISRQEGSPKARKLKQKRCETPSFVRPPVLLLCASWFLSRVAEIADL